MNLYIAKGKAIIMIAMSFLLLASGLEVFSNMGNISITELDFQYMSTKQVKDISTKAKNYTSVLNDVFNQQIYSDLVKTSSLDSVNDIKSSKILTNEDIWHLPTKTGEVTTMPSSNHIAYDITSKNGTGEMVFPVSDGVVSGMFRDGAGALIVTILHNVDGKLYTSEYVHLASYAPYLYVGREVSSNDYIGKMGSSGNATGVHLHFSLVDCGLFSDDSCQDLNSFYSYARRRFNEGFFGLNSLINVPSYWG